MEGQSDEVGEEVVVVVGQLQCPDYQVGVGVQLEYQEEVVVVVVVAAAAVRQLRPQVERGGEGEHLDHQEQEVEEVGVGVEQAQ